MPQKKLASGKGADKKSCVPMAPAKSEKTKSNIASQSPVPTDSKSPDPKKAFQPIDPGILTEAMALPSGETLKSLTLLLMTQRLVWALENPEAATSDPLVKVAFSKGLDALKSHAQGPASEDPPQIIGIQGYDPDLI